MARGIAILVILATTAIQQERARPRQWLRRRRVRRWLERYTGEPFETHASTSDIATGVHLSEDIVTETCLQSPDIFRSKVEPDLWSIWQEEPPNEMRA